MNTYEEKMHNIPFGNSVFQNLQFGRGQQTPARLYRSCLLQLNQKMNALQECKFRRERSDVDIEEIENKLSRTIDSFERRRLEIDLQEKKFFLNNEIKLIEDVLVEINTYKYILKTLPEFTREEFEKGESAYWKKRLLNDARHEIISSGHVGKDTINSLEQIGVSVGKNKDGQFVFQEKDIINKENEVQDILSLKSHSVSFIE